MARDWKPRPAPRPTSLTEIARRYHAAAVALAQSLGLSVLEVLTQHRESVTAIFIESGRCDLRLPAGVKLPPLVTTTPVAATNGSLSTVGSDDGQGEPRHGDVPDVPPPTGEASLPTTVPAGLPCAGQAIATCC